MDNQTFDPWDHSQFYNLRPPPADKKETKSMMAKDAAKAGTSAPPPVKPSIVEKKEKPASTMADKYRSAWMVIYFKKEKWRQKEIDRTLKSGKLSDEGWDTDFVKEVIALAESDKFDG